MPKHCARRTRKELTHIDAYCCLSALHCHYHDSKAKTILFCPIVPQQNCQLTSKFRILTEIRGQILHCVLKAQSDTKFNEKARWNKRLSFHKANWTLRGWLCCLQYNMDKKNQIKLRTSICWDKLCQKLPPSFFIAHKQVHGSGCCCCPEDIYVWEERAWYNEMAVGTSGKCVKQ